MNYKILGSTGVKVSGLCFGTMSFGGDADEDTSRAMFARCREVGINFFDCANIYAGGRSEEVLGRLMAGQREQVVITSKVYFPVGADMNQRGATRKHIRHAVEDSLRRLNTDYIDVYFIHRFDDLTPLEETLRALDDLVRQGKILYPAASNFAAWQVEKGLGISARQGWARFEVLQPLYSLVKRQAEVEILPMAQAEGLGVISYSPLAGGLLTGKYNQAQGPVKGRLLESKFTQARYEGEKNLETAAGLVQLARETGCEAATLGVAWVAAHPGMTAPIIGARNVQQLEASLAAAELEMTPELYARISALSTEPPPATDRSEERTPFNFGTR